MIRQDWSTLKKLMFAKTAAGGKAVEDTATGNPLTFLTDLARPLKSLLIPFTPQQTGSGDPSPVNIRPIVPWDGLKVWNGGKNLFDASAVIRRDGYMLNEQGQEITSNTSGYMQNITPVKPSTQYTFSGIVSHNGYLWRIYFFDKNGSLVSRTDAIDGFTDGNTFTFTTPSNCYGISFKYTKAFVDSSTFMLEAGQTATAYEPYKPITETDISFASPVYGGILDAVTGVLTVDTVCDTLLWGDVSGSSLESVTRKAFLLSHDSPNTSTKDGKYCDKARFLNDYSSNTTHFYTAVVGGKSYAYIYLPNGTPDTETVQVAYPLAEPYEVQLTPAQITALVGNNTIWSDANGSMTAVYLKKG